MPCTIVVGGQYGSEGKGKVVALCAERLDDPCVVRCGGPNSGHSLTIQGTNVVLRQVPAGVNHPAATLFIAAGCAIDENVLINELDTLALPANRIVLDPRAILIEQVDQDEEDSLVSRIASTGSGTGSALARRVKRLSEVRFAADSPTIRKRVRVECVAEVLHSRLDEGRHVIVEGTQGFGLSLLHGPKFPYLTSRDTTASGFASEVGLSPRQIDHIVMVIRTFPIRVGGNSGRLQDEITWDDVRLISRAPEALPEYTSVTKRLRRVGRFDLELVTLACRYNRPTALALMGIDRLDHINHLITKEERLSTSARSFIENVEKDTKIPVVLVGTGFGTQDAIWLRSIES